MKSTVQTVRFPEDFEAAVLHLKAEQGKTRTQLIRGALILAWQDYFVSQLGHERIAELVRDYQHQKSDGEE